VSCPACYGPSKSQDRRDKTFVSHLGEIVLAGRAYYLGPACHQGHVPVDAGLGPSAGNLTQRAEDVATPAGTVGRFADAAEELLPKLAGLRPAESTVERTTEAAGARLAEMWGEGHTLGPTADWRWNHVAKGRTSPTSASSPRVSACRAGAGPGPMGRWPGWVRS
jgi:hypothetical protein